MGFWGNTANQQQSPKKLINISVDQLNSNQQAVPVKYLAGRFYVAGDYISPCYNPITKAIKSGAGKSQSSTTGYKYFADFALVFCTGGRNPVDAVYTVIEDSDIQWSGKVSRNPAHDYETVTITNPNGKNVGTFHIYWGTETQAIDQILLTPRETLVGGGSPLDQTTWPPNTGSIQAGDPNPFSGHYDQHPAYRGQCYAVFKKWNLGRDRTSVPNIQFELERGCPAPWTISGFAPSDPNGTGVNPIAVLYDWLTDTRFGMGMPDASLNLATFSSTYNQLEALGARISPLITAQDDFRQIIAQLLEYFDGWIRMNGTLLEVGLWSHGTVISSGTLTDDDLLAEPELEPQGWGPTFNEVSVVYKDRQHHYNDYVQVYRDPNNFRITGMPRPETLSRPWITDATIAKNYAQTTGQILAMPFMQGNLKVKREWISKNNILPGLVFQYNSGFYDLSFLLRLDEIEYGADATAFATLTVEWERSKWPSLYVPPPFQGPGGFVIGPRALYASSITEVPYLIADHQFLTQVVPLAVVGDSSSQSFRVWASFDGGTVYQVVPNDSSTSSFTVFGQLTGGTATSIYFYLYGVGLDDIVSQMPAQQSNDTLLCFAGAEVFSIGAVTPQGGGLYYATILRGRLGTNPATVHSGGDALYFIFRDRLTLIDNAGFTPGATVLFKLQPFSLDVDYDLTQIAPISYTISGFADIPSPVFSPSSQGFTATQVVNLSTPPAGFVARYTANGTATTPTSSLWTGAVTLSGTTTLRARFYAQSGRQSMETIAQYTLSGTTSTVASPTWTFSGTLTHTTGTLVITPTTAGSTVNYNLSGAGYVAGTAGAAVTLSLNCTSSIDYVYFFASLTGQTPSPVTFIDNRGSISCATPTWSFSGTLNQTSGLITLTLGATGTAISYQKNYGTVTTYTTPVSLACTSTGDHIEFWATALGLADSVHVAVDNTLAAACPEPYFTYTGTVGHGVIIVTLHPAPGPTTTISYIKTGGPITTYSAPVNVGLNGSLEFWGSASGLADSPHQVIFNEIGGPGAP